ncbi:hypothetical protein TrispH2_012090 [Trichoplax sp. H2]|nr:hypothetical protein TrispH2_012090 [Trichoplax sp. H2]|eukprot:RDD35953.1 hypothetical protein TrispH2_012090 [Trichoplax sp. H2]
MEDDSGFRSLDSSINETGIRSDENLRESDYEKLKPDGLRKTKHGIDFQLALQILVANRANSRNCKFIMSSEAKEAHNLDDLVIDYGHRIVFVQAKHAAETVDTDSHSSNIASTSKDSKRKGVASKSYSKKDFS